MENQKQTQTPTQVQAPVQPQAQVAIPQIQKSEELLLVEARAAAEFAVTPAGQMLRTFETTQRIGKMLSTSTIIPLNYQNNVANCAIAVDVAMHLGNGISPLTVMQNLVIVGNRPTWGASFLIGCINTCGRFSSIQYKMENLGKVGKTLVSSYEWDSAKNKPSTKSELTDKYAHLDNMACTAYATDKTTGETLVGSTIDIKMALAEGWYTKSNSKWQSMPEQMLRYRAAAFWQRAYAPEIGLGFHTQEEIEDITVEDANVIEEIRPDAQAKSKAQKSIEAKKRRKAEEQAKQELDEAETATNVSSQPSQAELIADAAQDLPFDEPEPMPSPVRKSVAEQAREINERYKNQTESSSNIG